MRHKGVTWRNLTGWALALPFLLLSLVADGVMLRPGAEGPLVVLCTDQGMVEVRIDPATGQPQPADPQTGTDKGCDWAQARLAVALLPAPALPVPVQTLAPAQPALPPVILTLAQVTGLPPATGPPAVS